MIMKQSTTINWNVAPSRSAEHPQPRSLMSTPDRKSTTALGLLIETVVQPHQSNSHKLETLPRASLSTLAATAPVRSEVTPSSIGPSQTVTGRPLRSAQDAKESQHMATALSLLSSNKGEPTVLPAVIAPVSVPAQVAPKAAVPVVRTNPLTSVPLPNLRPPMSIVEPTPVSHFSPASHHSSRKYLVSARTEDDNRQRYGYGNRTQFIALAVIVGILCAVVIALIAYVGYMLQDRANTAASPTVNLQGILTVAVSGNVAINRASPQVNLEVASSGSSSASVLRIASQTGSGQQTTQEVEFGAYRTSSDTVFRKSASIRVVTDAITRRRLASTAYTLQLNSDSAEVTCPLLIGSTLQVSGAASFASAVTTTSLTSNGAISVGGALSTQGNAIFSAAVSAGSLTTSGPVSVLGSFSTQGPAALSSTLQLSGAALFSSSLQVNGPANFASVTATSITCNGAMSLSGGLTTLGIASLSALQVDGGATFSSLAAFDSATFNSVTFNSAATFHGAALFNSAMQVAGAATFSVVNAASITSSGSVSVAGGLSAQGAAVMLSSLQVASGTNLGSSLQVTGAVGLLSTLQVADTAIFASSVNAASISCVNALTIGGVLSTQGAATLASTLRVVGAATVLSTLEVDSGATFSSTLTAASVISAGAASVAGTLSVDGDVTLGTASAPFALMRPVASGAGTVTRIIGQSGTGAPGGDIVLDAGTGTVSGDVRIGTANANAVTLARASVTTTVLGPLQVDAASASSIVVTGSLTTASLTISGVLTSASLTAGTLTAGTLSVTTATQLNAVSAASLSTVAVTATSLTSSSVSSGSFSNSGSLTSTELRSANLTTGSFSSTGAATLQTVRVLGTALMNDVSTAGAVTAASLKVLGDTQLTTANATSLISAEFSATNLTTGSFSSTGAATLQTVRVLGVSSLNGVSSAGAVTAASLKVLGDTQLTTVNATSTVRARLFDGLGVVPIGSVIAHFTGKPGAATANELYALGFAFCDGIPPHLQSDLLTDAVITTTPDLNGAQMFIRGTGPGGTVGTIQQHALQGHSHFVTGGGHSHTYASSNIAQSGVNAAGVDSNGAQSTAVGGTHSHDVSTAQNDGINGAVNVATETRPTNFWLVYIMRVK
eukprot:TRINITY_DN1289_c0_g1_i1.p1 TRINITY_DN1289_c0_g1~~TRINITY_DN1289_c0_g1_i1.p1  ORF type:complete len:1125 (-),score=181.80 TRINITY_DN1289_c0_g1_i1:2777-6151(-)